MCSTVGPSRFTSHYCINKETNNKEKVSPKILKWLLVRDMCAFEPKPFKNKTKMQMKHGLYIEYGRWLQKETMQILHTEVRFLTFPWYFLETLFICMAGILNCLQFENQVKSWVLPDVKGWTDLGGWSQTICFDWGCVYLMSLPICRNILPSLALA